MNLIPRNAKLFANFDGFKGLEIHTDTTEMYYLVRDAADPDSTDVVAWFSLSCTPFFGNFQEHYLYAAAVSGDSEICLFRRSNATTNIWYPWKCADRKRWIDHVRITLALILDTGGFLESRHIRQN